MNALVLSLSLPIGIWIGCAVEPDEAQPDLPASLLIDEDATPMAPLGGNRGSMPKETKTSLAAAAAIRTWVLTGAKHDTAQRADAGRDAAKDALSSFDTKAAAAPLGDASVSDAKVSDASVDAKSAAANDAAPHAKNVGAPVTWTSLYNTYFAPGTVGACGSLGCHSSTKGGFMCGATKDTCYAGLVSSGLVNTTNPTASLLGSTQLSPLAWFGGSMPPGVGANPTAKNAVSAWLAAGALNN